jgi:hypothetical protein
MHSITSTANPDIQRVTNEFLGDGVRNERNRRMTGDNRWLFDGVALRSQDLSRRLGSSTAQSRDSKQSRDRFAQNDTEKSGFLIKSA